MVFQRFKEGFDQCDPPICPQDLNVRIVSIECVNNEVYVSWTVEDIYNRDLAQFTKDNKVSWSLNNQVFGSSSNAFNNTDPYFTAFDKPTEDGLIYIKASAIVSDTFIESEVGTLHTDGCNICNGMVKASICQCSNGGIAPYDLYVDCSAVPSSASFLPIYFSHDDFCWFITENDVNNTVSLDSENNIVLSSLSNINTSCEACCLGCPSVWAADAEDPGNSGKDRTSIYVEYETYFCKDRIKILGPDTSLDCSDGSVLWDSGCVASCRDEGPGTFVSQRDSRACGEDCPEDDFQCKCAKSDCFTIRRDQLPLTISVESDCESTCNTKWCAYIEGPDFTICACSDEDKCVSS